MSFSTPLLCTAIYISLYLAYSILSPKFDNERKKAYILSSISSLTMTSLSIPFFISYLQNGLKMTFENGQSGWMGECGRLGCIFFGVYLFADLSIGYVKYRSQIGLLTGWIHHTVYIGLMFYVLHTDITPIFLVGAIMELPTFDLAISNLFPKVRNDLRFLSSFFIFRIAFHIIYLVDCAKPSSRSFMGNTYIPSIILSLALIMHISWFKGGLTGYLKRCQSNIKLKHKKEVIEQDPIIEWANSLDSTISKEILPENKTPDDSPLVTPRTPSQTPFLFSSIPISNLSLPSIPSISSIQNLPIPSINLSEFTSSKLVESGNGFKEAVKHRWDEQKEKFMTHGLIKRNGIRKDGSEDDNLVLVREVEVE